MKILKKKLIKRKLIIIKHIFNISKKILLIKKKIKNEEE